MNLDELDFSKVSIKTYEDAYEIDFGVVIDEIRGHIQEAVKVLYELGRLPLTEDRAIYVVTGNMKSVFVNRWSQDRWR